MPNLTIEECDFIRQQDHDTLAAWWCDINHGSFRPNCPQDRRWAVMRKIADIITIKECLRCWNKAHMTDEDFELWWAGDMTAADALGIKLITPLEGNIKVKPEAMGRIH